MANAIDFIRNHFNLSEKTEIRIDLNDIIVHGVRVAKIHKASDTTLLTISGSAEVIDLNKIDLMSDYYY